MKLGRPLLLAAVLIAAAAAVGLWAWRLLPATATIAVHFNPEGEPDGFLPKAVGLALAPALGAATLLALAFAPRVVRDKGGLAAASGAYGVALIGVAAMVLVAQAAIAVRAMDPSFDVIRWVFLAIGILFAVLGNLLGKIGPNRLIGIRTRWTLGDRRVWDRTHRFTGRLMLLAGVALAAIAWLGADHTDLFVALLACAAVPAVAGVVYARNVQRQLGNS